MKLPAVLLRRVASISRFIFIGSIVAVAPAQTSRPVAVAQAPPLAVRLERVSAAVPFPRGLVEIDGKIFVLSRGRVRGSGGVDPALDDMAGTIWEVDPNVAEPVGAEVSPEVRANGRVFAAPTSPPFNLFDRSVAVATDDRKTDRPYCTLRYDEASRNLILCAFSGIDKPRGPGGRSFSKNLTDALLRYDLRTGQWHEIERHDIEAGGIYPHHDTARNPPPHGRLNGPDNCLVVGDGLYAVGKDNSLLARYDLSPIRADPAAGPPPSQWMLGDEIRLRDGSVERFHGHSMLAERDGWLYLGYRTSSVIVRFRLERNGLPVQPIVGELVARFDPYDPETQRSADLTDMAFDSTGRLIVVSAQPARLYRFAPDPDRVFDARDGARAPWVNLAEMTGNASMKIENVFVDALDRAYVTSGDAYGHDPGLGGAVWRAIEEGAGRH